MSENNQLTVRHSLMPVIHKIDDLVQIGKMFEESGMFGCSQQGQGTVLAMTCIQEGMTPLQFIERYHIVEGRPSMRADAMLARLLELGGSYQVVARDADKASIEAQFRNAVYTSTLTWADASQEPFTKDRGGKPKHNWATPRSRMQMLWARVVSDAVRVVCPLANFGSYTEEEIRDMAPAPVVDEPTRTRKPTMTVVEATEVLPPAEKPAQIENVEVVGDGTDYSVMPVGKFKGKAWADFTDVQLEKALTLANEAIVEGHKVAIRAELDKRNAAGGQ